ncbi:uncharacterized protein LY89DRAFT_675761 [Mollisia scopiformis]|uniref:Uncharacterized protein n=1 Tax=Mollisia scopiformis TaxID=149040 RepID=A0A132BB29_MOLSC|nr:uncharacterized protein LY89DRAFT_675761 [Mollisia scopiformis]KUJ09591.1 hypothetical protein LY89DRAFT_675761 [Mollisia scopiformis]
MQMSIATSSFLGFLGSSTFATPFNDLVEARSTDIEARQSCQVYICEVGACLSSCNAEAPPLSPFPYTIVANVNCWESAKDETVLLGNRLGSNVQAEEKKWDQSCLGFF